LSNDPTSADALRHLSEEVARTREVLNARLSDDPVRESAFQKLYDELKQYKDDFVFQSEKPLLLDLLLFYDSLNWFQQSMVEQEMSPDVIADSFQYLVEEFLEILYRRDVTPMEARERFDRKTHKVVKVTAADNPDDDGAVNQVLKRGFTRGGRPLRPEEVVISRWRQGAD